MKRGVLALCLVYLAITRLSAQTLSVELYKVKVVTKAGKRIRGTLDDVSDAVMHIGNNNLAVARSSGSTVSLSDVRKVVIRRQSRRRATITGAIVGGIVTGGVVVQTSRKNPFSSSVLYGINLLLAAGGGAAAGALVGHGVGNTTQRVIRPLGRNPEVAVENLRRQLEPFTYSYQNTILNRVRP